MKQRRLFLLLLTLTVGYAAGCQSGARQSAAHLPTQTVWEYKVIPAADSSADPMTDRLLDDPEKVLQELGADRWELVAVEPRVRDANSALSRYIFKRPK